MAESVNKETTYEQTTFSCPAEIESRVSLYWRSRVFLSEIDKRDWPDLLNKVLEHKVLDARLGTSLFAADKIRK
ncbi:hypothetical protein CYMTET_5490 [Cymbomonas tetramitiformis]|uniref:Uncharacterized protein n=1 Tax=Cymbomonas tetramitiformis TaxID=36881 RepID=A0AAE0LJ08_9CHLO|nr:hypothetical protein CYMTET_5490 [Cymbomonas tetramitiformis]